MTKSLGKRVRKTRISKEEFIAALHRVLNGETYLELTKDPAIPYQVPFLSTKLREIAQELNLEKELDAALRKQKEKRIGSPIKDWGKQYVKDNIDKATEWKELPINFNYLISNNGLLKIARTGKIKIPSIQDYGFTKYARYYLSKEGVGQCYPAHRLVAMTFKPTSDMEYLQIDHIDRNGLNNDYHNLDWVTGSENILRSFEKNYEQKLEIVVKGNKKAIEKAQKSAEERFQRLLGDRFVAFIPIKGRDSNVTYICKGCRKELTKPTYSKDFRYGADGICPKCRRVFREDGRL